jgi:RloB-like protein
VSKKPRHKKSGDDLRRKRPGRDPYPRILMVFEGSVTEPKYFKDLTKLWGLNPRNVEIPKHSGSSDPVGVVDSALANFKDDNDFDKIYCIVDRDKHQKYSQALDKVRRHRLGRRGKLILITSNPCFEIWLLLHYVYTAAAFQCASISGSNADEVIRELRKHISGYDKGMEGLFVITQPNINDAKRHADQLLKYHKTAGSDGNPSSEIHFVIEVLEEMQRTILS